VQAGQIGLVMNDKVDHIRLRAIKSVARFHAAGIANPREQASCRSKRMAVRPGKLRSTIWRKQVLRIDGRPVSDYEGTFRSGSELNRIFIGRSSGDRISLEVMLPGKKKPKKLTITRRVVNREYPKIGGMPLD